MKRQHEVDDSRARTISSATGDEYAACLKWCRDNQDYIQRYIRLNVGRSQTDAAVRCYRYYKKTES